MTKYNSSPTHFLFHNRHSAWLWVIIRFYLGFEWLYAGYEKIASGLWWGNKAGVAITGFFNAALTKTSGAHPDVQAPYAWFIENIALPHAIFFSHLIVIGEISVGLALVLGIFTGIAAFFGATMNFNFMFAGSVSVNPYWVLLEILLIYGWRVAGYVGLDKYILKFWHGLQKREEY